MKRHPPEVDQFIRSHCTQYTAPQMAAMSKGTLGFELTAAQIHTYMHNHKIRGPKKGKKLPERRITTPAMDAFIRMHCKGVGPNAMTDLVNRTFGTSFTQDQMKGYYSRNHINSGLDGRFKMGHEPANKGKTWDEFMPPESQARCRTTTYKPGNVPHNGGAPVGTLHIRHDHKNRGSKPYVWQKVAEPNVWRMKHVVEWEAHNGPVPEGYMVTFANGDTLNWHIDNLILESRAQHAVKNRWGIHGHDKESAQTANTIADLKITHSQQVKKRRLRGRPPDKRGPGCPGRKREPTYGELVTRLCQLRDEMGKTPAGRCALVAVIVTLKYAIANGITYYEEKERIKNALGK